MVTKKTIRYKKTAYPVPVPVLKHNGTGLKHNGTGLIKEQEASYITSNIGVTIPSTEFTLSKGEGFRTGLKTFKKGDFYSPSEIIALFQSKKIDKEWSFIEYKPSDTSKLTHCYHRYPAKFIPQLVERLMDEYL
ncbi:MAG: hypothetical protein HY097_01085 [Nitrospinae bacterium]|nr:hypothetical protein [Nitrospinota bacterium]